MYATIVFFMLWSLVESRTVYQELYLPTGDQLTFMRKYGYLPCGEGSMDESGVDCAITPYSILEAVRRMQAFAGLPPTGLLDQETRKLFTKRRCGMKDIDDSRTRSRRYVLQKSWDKHLITFRIINGSRTLGQPEVEELTTRALDMWAPYGGLQFVKTDNGPADIQVSFVVGEHGDGVPFDGPGRVVAHAFLPPHGAIHFDDDELWGAAVGEEDSDATDYFAVAVHEIGHALGLWHSSVKESVMYPYYQVPVERLYYDDIMGMRALYLEEEPESAVIVPTPAVPRVTKFDGEDDVEEEDIPDLCFTNYDSIQVINGKIFVFEEEWVWVLRQRKLIVPGYPRRFREVFRGLPEHVHVVRTVYQMRNGNVRVFSGRRYWEFSSQSSSRFRLIHKGNITEYGLPRSVTELSTVFVSNYNNKTYLIEYERFWRYDEDQGTMDPGYPKDMSAWRQVPAPVDSAIIWEGDTFFFRGPRHWRFDNELVRAHDYYPLPTAQVWFPCNRTDDMDLYVTNDGP